MKRAFNEIQSDLNAALGPIGLRMLSFSAMSIVADNPGLRQSQLAEALSIERPNAVVVVDELERKGLVLRGPAPGDRRAYALELTDIGQSLLVEAMEAVRAHDARMTAALSHTERQALIDALHKIELAKAGGGDIG